MSRVCGMSQYIQGITMERVVSLFTIASLDHDGYTGVKGHYFSGEAALVNCYLLKLSSLLSSKETRQWALGIPIAPPSTTIPNRVSNTPTTPPPRIDALPHILPNPQHNHPLWPTHPQERYLGIASPQRCGKINPIQGAI